MGFAVENHDYYCGSIVFPGTGDGEIGMFAHLDVVPEGEGWLAPPYSPYIKDGWLYGRGSSDNKGAAVTAFYAMRYLKESGVRPRHTLRLFLGCSEENGMYDIDYYLKRYRAPDFSIVPDASFSVCYSEKGILEVDFAAPLPAGMTEFHAGTASNAVAGNARATVKLDAECPDEPDPEKWPGVTLEQCDGMLCVKAEGKSAHAAFPEGSVNAAVLLADYLCSSGVLDAEGEKTLRFLSDHLDDHYGRHLGIACDGGPLGPLTVVAGMTRVSNGELRQNINIRYPAGMDSEKLIAGLTSEAAACGWTVRMVRHDPPAYVAPDSEFVQMLDGICKEELGDSFAPYTMGGGTYARKLPNAVGFGPGIRGQEKPGPAGHGGGHQPDECVWLEGLENAFRIYVKALQKLDGMF